MALLRLVAALTLASSVAASLLLPGQERSRPLQPQHASRQQLPRRSLFGLGTAAAVAAAFPVRVQPAAAAGNALPLPPAAVVLQIADNTIAMQGMMIQSVKDMDDLTEQQRKDVGRWPPIGRGELKQSVDVLQHGQSGPSAVPQLSSCASSGRAPRLRAARQSQGRGQPTEPPATALVARASRLQSRRFHRLCPFRCC